MESKKVKEIKKALECCSNPTCPSFCPLKGYHSKGYKILCRDKLVKDCLTIINELESENERLLNKKWDKEDDLDNYHIENQQLKERIAELEKENAKYKRKLTTNQWVQEIRKNALNQFAERLKEKCKERYMLLHNHTCFGDIEFKINETLKEFINKGDKER
jgi:hypothetical protein